MTSRSPSRTWPADTRTMPTMLLSRVLLPDPFGPTTETTSPGAACTEMPRITGSRPYPAVSPSARICRPPRALSRQGRPPRPRPARAAGPSCPRPARCPSAITITGSQNSSMIASSCSTISTVMPSRLRATEHVADPAGQLGMHAGHRLVEQQQLRVGHQRPHDLDEPPLPAAQVAGVLAGQRLQAEPAQHAAAWSIAAASSRRQYRRPAQRAGQRVAAVAGTRPTAGSP